MIYSLRFDRSDNSPDQKEMIKDILKSLNKDIQTKRLPQIIASLSTKLKTFLPLATPSLKIHTLHESSMIIRK